MKIWIDEIKNSIELSSGIVNSVEIFFGKKWIPNHLKALLTLRERSQFDADYFSETIADLQETQKNLTAASFVSMKIIELVYRRFIVTNRYNPEEYPLSTEVINSDNFKEFLSNDEAQEVINDCLDIDLTQNANDYSFTKEIKSIAAHLSNLLFDKGFEEKVDQILMHTSNVEDYKKEIINDHLKEKQQVPNLLICSIQESAEIVNIRINNNEEELIFINSWLNGEISKFTPPKRQEIEIQGKSFEVFVINTMADFLDFFNHFKLAFHVYLNLMDVLGLTDQLDKEENSKHYSQTITNTVNEIDKKKISQIDKLNQMAEYLETKLRTYHGINVMKNKIVDEDSLQYEHRTGEYIIDLYS